MQDVRSELQDNQNTLEKAGYLEYNTTKGSQKNDFFL